MPLTRGACQQKDLRAPQQYKNSHEVSTYSQDSRSSQHASSSLPCSLAYLAPRKTMDNKVHLLMSIAGATAEEARNALVESNGDVDEAALLVLAEASAAEKHETLGMPTARESRSTFDTSPVNNVQDNNDSFVGLDSNADSEDDDIYNYGGTPPSLSTAVLSDPAYTPYTNLEANRNAQEWKSVSRVVKEGGKQRKCIFCLA